MFGRAEIKIIVGSFSVEYAECGSHMMEITTEMSVENMKTLRDELTREINRTPDSFDEMCTEEPIGAGPNGVVTCILKNDHDGPCDGGAREKQLADELSAQMMKDRFDNEVWDK